MGEGGETGVAMVIIVDEMQGSHASHEADEYNANKINVSGQVCPRLISTKEAGTLINLLNWTVLGAKPRLGNPLSFA